VDNKKFLSLLDKILSSLVKYNVRVKLIGGVAVALHNVARETKDLDLVIKQSMDATNNLISALEECGFGERDDLLEQIFGADPHEEMYLFAMSRLMSTKQEFEGFVIDVFFDFGKINYDAIEAKPTKVRGYVIDTAIPSQLLKLKRAVNPPRDQDMKDIQTLEKLVNEEAQPYKKSNIFGGGENG